MSYPAQITSKAVRAAASLTNGVAATTTSVPCFGARQVSFYLTATDANTLTAATVPQVSNDGTNWATAGSATGCTAIGTIAVVALNAGGAVGTFGSSNASSPYIPWKYARLTATAGGTTVAGLAVQAYVFFDEVGQSVAQSEIATF